jgi:hypothetical protein
MHQSTYVSNYVFESCGVLRGLENVVLDVCGEQMLKVKFWRPYRNFSDQAWESDALETPWWQAAPSEVYWNNMGALGTRHGLWTRRRNILLAILRETLGING